MGVPCPCVGAVATIHRDGGKWALGRAVGPGQRDTGCEQLRAARAGEGLK